MSISRLFLFRIANYIAFGIPFIYSITVFVFGDRWSPPTLSYEALVAILAVTVPLIGSISTLFGAVAIWSWAISKQLTRRGLDEISEAQDELSQIMHTLDTRRGDVTLEDVPYVREMIRTCAAFQNQLLEITPGWDPAARGEQMMRNIGVFFNARDEFLKRLEGMRDNPIWSALFRNIDNLNRRIRDGLSEISDGVTFRQTTGDIFKHVGVGLGITLILAITAAIALLVNDQNEPTSQPVQNWWLVPVAYLALFISVQGISRPVRTLWEQWRREQVSNSSIQERVEIDAQSIRSIPGLDHPEKGR